MFKVLLFIIVLVLLAIIESSLIGIPLLLLFVFSWSVYSKKRVFWVAFVSGLLVDVFTPRAFGATGLYFLIISLIVSRYQKKIQTRNILYLFIFSFASVVVYQLIYSRSVNVLQLVLSAIFIVLVGVFVNILSERMERGRKELLF